MSLSLAILVAPSLGQILTSPDLRGAAVGAFVATTDGRGLWAKNADARLMPASNQKLFSVAYALDVLGPAYRSETRFWRDEDSIGIDSDGTLDVSYAKLKAFAENLGRRPRAVLWQAYRPGRPGSWQIGDAVNRYAPTIAAFSCERAGVEVRANREGGLEFVPAAFGITVRDVREAIGAEARRIAKGLRYDPTLGEIYRARGAKIAPGAVDTLSQPFPDLSAAELFGEETEDGPDPSLIRRRAPDATLLTDPIGVVAGRCLKPSDNYLAEHLLMMAATREVGSAADWESGPKAFADWSRRRVSLPEGTFDPADGSGLSRKNLVTSRAVVRLLNWARTQGWGATYLDALAKPGEGTLKGRLAGVGFRGKTGTLTGVSSLSGLVRTKSGRELAVSLIMNHYPCSAARARQIQDEWVRRVAATF